MIVRTSSQYLSDRSFTSWILYTYNHNKEFRYCICSIQAHSDDVNWKRVKNTVRTTLRDCSWMAPSRPSCLIPTLSRVLTMMADTKPSTHNSAPRKQSKVKNTFLLYSRNHFNIALCMRFLIPIGFFLNRRTQFGILFVSSFFTYRPRVSTACHIVLQISEWGRSSGLTPGERKPRSDQRPTPAPSLWTRRLWCGSEQLMRKWKRAA